jgi:UDP-N-acetylmuramate--alanine ligase
VITNIEKEHMEHYGSFNNVVRAYTEFIGRIRPDGFLVFNGEDKELSKLASLSSVKKISFGIGEGVFDATCREVFFAGPIRAELMIGGRPCGKITSTLIGRHNLMNILAASAACMGMGMSEEKIAEAVATFRGVKRRFELVDEIGNIRVVEDYAHHPTELKAVLRSAKSVSKGRVIALFQPHRYSRTKYLMRDFAACFFDADVLILTDIYSADEDDAENIRIEELYGLIEKDKFEETRLMAKEKTPRAIADMVKDNDLVLILGAGDVREEGARIVEEIKKTGKGRGRLPEKMGQSGHETKS